MKSNSNFINFRKENIKYKNYCLLWSANWIGHILQRNCLLRHVFKGKIEGRICDEKTKKKTQAVTG